MPKYRIIYVDTGSIDPCCWQAQKRVWLFFWRNLCGRTASATTQAHEIALDMLRAAGGQDAFNAALDAVEIELPGRAETGGEGIDSCRRAITATGLGLRIK